MVFIKLPQIFLVFKETFSEWTTNLHLQPCYASVLLADCLTNGPGLLKVTLRFIFTSIWCIKTWNISTLFFLKYVVFLVCFLFYLDIRFCLFVLCRDISCLNREVFIDKNIFLYYNLNRVLWNLKAICVFSALKLFNSLILSFQFPCILFLICRGVWNTTKELRMSYCQATLIQKTWYFLLCWCKVCFF